MERIYGKRKRLLGICGDFLNYFQLLTVENQGLTCNIAVYGPAAGYVYVLYIGLVLNNIDNLD